MTAGEDQPAWILHRRPFRETSVLVELFTQEHGRLGALARGARRRGWSGLLEPFVPLRVGWRGRGDLKTLTAVEQAGAGYALRGRAVACGFYMAELLLLLTRREDPHPRAWVRFGAAVDDLARTDPEPGLRRFELALLAESGYGLRLEADRHGQPLAPEARYRYLPEQGAIPVSASSEGVEVSGRTLIALREAEESSELGVDPARSEARRLMRFVLHHHLEGRRLRSRDMYRSLEEGGRTSGPGEA